MALSIIERIYEFDGKHTAPLEQISKEEPTQELIDDLFIVFNENKRTEEAASWVLKAWVDRGYHPDDSTLTKWYDYTIAADSWAPILHFVQAIDALELSKKQVSKILESVFLWTNHDNNMVRAWSYNALHRIHLQHPGSISDFETIIEHGIHDEAASVRARLRRIKSEINNDNR